MSDPQLLDNKAKLAILYFKAKDYEKALAEYGSLIETLSSLSPQAIKAIRKQQYNLHESPVIGPIIHPRLGSLYDQRAATYEKLGQFASAIKDAKLLIKIEPIGCKGYLRLGKLLIGIGKTVEAYKCFQEGIYIIEKAMKQYQVEVPEKLFQNLKAQYRDLNQELKSRKKRKELNSNSDIKRLKMKGNKNLDPFIWFPLDIIQIIFEDFSLKEVLKCHSVSKLWYSCLINIPQLYVTRIHFKSYITLPEFTSGVKKLKKIVANSHSQSLKHVKVNSTFNLQHLHKILEIIISEPNMSIQSLDMIDKNINLQLFYNRLCKAGWRMNNFQNLNSLRMGLNCSIKHGEILLNLFKSLKHLELIVVFPELSSTYRDLIPSHDKIFKRLNDQEKEKYPLESLVLVNHPDLLKGKNSLQPSSQTYNPYPLFFEKNFPNLSQFTVCSFDFANSLPQFGQFLIQIPQCTKIYLENNQNLNMLQFLQMLKNFNPGFTLDEFVFRESKVHGAMTLNDFTMGDIPQLHKLSKLDIYGHCLSGSGLTKLLKITHSNLTNLSIGASNYVSFELHSQTTVQLRNILKYCPQLTSLYLNEMGINQYSLSKISSDLKSGSTKLSYLDLSYNSGIDGTGLIRLFEGLPSGLSVLVMHGVEIPEETINYIIRRGFVGKVVQDRNRIKWRLFGVNSWIQ
ncbi:Protein DIA2 [Spathaspora sp. JA1]|nr:Protein DIA2 [Spathaspora sp. JA1]